MSTQGESKNEGKSEAPVNGRPGGRKAQPAYSKRQYAASAVYTHVEKDMIQALLEDERLYTRAELQAIIHSFINQEAK